MPVATDPVFGVRSPLARRFAEHLVTSGVERGLLGPREAPRVWDRHVLNCAVVAELVPDGARVVDVGSGAGLPGIPLALARPDLQIVLVEPLARRVEWLREVIADLGLAIEVERGRAEEAVVRRRWEGADVVTARAVAPLSRLAAWSLPLLRIGGRLLAVKGASAPTEIERDGPAVRRLGGGPPRIERCGVGVVDPPSTVVVVERVARTGRRPAATRERTGVTVSRETPGWTPIAEEAERAARVLHPDRHQMPRPARRRVITVANQKGGVGKTTSTVNLAAALAMHGVRVLVIDLDPQGNTSTALGVEHRVGTPSIYEALLGEISLAEAAVASTASPDLLCVPATIDLAGAEIELVSMVAREGRLAPGAVRRRAGRARRGLRLRGLPALARPAHGERPGRRRRRC